MGDTLSMTAVRNFWTFFDTLPPLYCVRTYRLFMCQDENEREDESFHSFWITPVTNEPGS